MWYMHEWASRPAAPSAALMLSLFFFFNDTATTEIYTLSLHDALPILVRNNPRTGSPALGFLRDRRRMNVLLSRARDRKSTRLNSSHSSISYAVFCLKKKNNNQSLLGQPLCLHSVHGGAALRHTVLADQ